MIQKRDKYLHVRVSYAEKQALKILASMEYRKPSEMVRELIREALKDRKIDILNWNELVKNRGGPDV